MIRARFLFFCGLLILSSRCIQSKPVEEKTSLDTKPIVVPDPVDLASSDTNPGEQTRVSRQNIRVINGDDVEVFSPPPPPPGSSSVPPRRQRPGLISLLLGKKRDGVGFITSLLGTSSSASAPQVQNQTSVEQKNRIRRQAEQFLASLQKNFKNGSNTFNATAFNELIRQTRLEVKQNATKQSAKQQQYKIVNQDQVTAADETSDEDDDEDEPPGGGDGMGGGILGILASSESDLGTLLSTVSAIVGNLSGGPGFDLNAVIGSAIALIGSILAGDGTLPIGKQIATYMITVLEGITGGGAMNNGQFFGNLVTTLVGGSSSVLDEEGEPQPASDSGTFFLSLLSALLSGSSGGR